MAEDELIIPIDKALWPKGVTRGLTPALRELGDKHGNLVIVAQAAKGSIMVKGPLDRIEQAKPGLRAIIEEHFPDVDTPEELLEGGAAALAVMAAPAARTVEGPQPTAAAATPTPKAPEPAKAPSAAPTAPEAAPVRAPPASMKPVAAVARQATEPPPDGPRWRLSPRKPARPSLLASGELLWQCVRKSSSFQRCAGKHHKRPFSADPANLLGFHAQKFSSSASHEALDVRPVKRGKKLAIDLVVSTAKKRHRPRSLFVTTGLSKSVKRGLSRLHQELCARPYRPALYGLAARKYLKVQRVVARPPKIVKDRRSKK